MKTPGNFLANGSATAAPSPATAPQPNRAVRAPSPAAPYKAPVSDGSSQGPLIGDRQRIAAPPSVKVASTAGPARQSNDRTSGMAASMGALADKMHPVKRR